VQISFNLNTLPLGASENRLPALATTKTQLDSAQFTQVVAAPHTSYPPPTIIAAMTRLLALKAASPEIAA